MSLFFSYIYWVIWLRIEFSQNFEDTALFSSSFEKYNVISIPDSLSFPTLLFWKLLKSSLGP